ncbi:ferredoxin-type protein NapF [Tropicimonas sp. TH_r6]|uniref:ferredoxin-type protein NapF n=1 Tax=Tropicimonas sp. TH_r6 TaxID=3082085 RepID=UPI00295507B3|nr:ferredoxin-type protein NapF [Tropicimonas sp. TH_r6]MDV7144161.1 ferredoxin-type protein NapF [Tropicimonas sp. TH_r6]
MGARASRRDFLRADFLRNEIMRPYGAGPPAEFDRLCDGCEACIPACPENVIRRGHDGKALIDFSNGECSFCEDCIKACPTGALSEAGRERWNWVARVSNQCLSVRGVTCRACEDFCEARAIRFRLETGGRSRPLIDLESCTGCGACAGACPETAIDFARNTEQQGELTA